MDHSHEAEHIAAHIGAYLKVGIGLLILTGVTVALSYVDFGSRANNIIVGMIVATPKPRTSLSTLETELMSAAVPKTEFRLMAAPAVSVPPEVSV